MNSRLTLLLLLLPVLAAAQAKIDYKRTGAPLPPFVLEQPNGKPLSDAALQKGKPVMLMIFSPECDHCANKLDSLKTLAATFKTTQLLLVTELRNKAALNPFLKKKGFNKTPLFKNIGLDRANLVYNIYTYSLLPQYNFYNTQHKLVKTFTGNAPIDSLRMYIK